MELLNTTSKAAVFQTEIEYYQNQQVILAQKTERYNEFLTKYYDELVTACKKSGIEVIKQTQQSITSSARRDKSSYEACYNEDSCLQLEFNGDFCGRNKPVTKKWGSDYDKLNEKAQKLQGYILENFKAEGFEVRPRVNSHTLEVEEGKERRILLTIYIK